MEQNKPMSVAVSAVKPVGASSVAAVKPISSSATSINLASSAPKAAAPAAKQAAEKKAKPVAKRKVKVKAKAKPTAAKKAKPVAKKVTKTVKARVAPKAAKKPTSSAAKKTSAAKPLWGSASAIKNPFASASSASAKSSQMAGMTGGMDFMKLGTDAIKGIFGPGAADAQKMSEKVFGFGKEGADHVTRSAEAASRSLNEAVAISQDNMEACVECGNITAELSKAVSEEVFEFTNQLFSKNVDLSKQLFACRTINDMFDLQSKFFKTNIDKIFNETAKISEMSFKMASKASEPINGRVAAVSKRVKKSFSA